MALLCDCSMSQKSRAYKNITNAEDIEEYTKIEITDEKAVMLKDAKVLTSKAVDLELWGNVQVICAYTNLLVEDEKYQKPWLGLFYLANKEGKEIYKLNYGGHDIFTGFVGIKDIYFSDIDQDNLTDIIITEIDEQNTGKNKGKDFLTAHFFLQREGDFVNSPMLDTFVSLGINNSVFKNRKIEDKDYVVRYAKKLLKEDPDIAESIKPNSNGD